MRNVCKAWNAICTSSSYTNTQLSVKMAPKLRHFGAKYKQLPGYHGQNKA